MESAVFLDFFGAIFDVFVIVDGRSLTCGLALKSFGGARRDGNCVGLRNLGAKRRTQIACYNRLINYSLYLAGAAESAEIRPNPRETNVSQAPM